MLQQTPRKTINDQFRGTTIVEHFQKARNIDEEASLIESKIENRIQKLKDKCEQYRETIHRDQERYNQTKTIVQMRQTAFFQQTKNFNQNQNNCYHTTNIKDNIMETLSSIDRDPKILALKREIKDLKLEIRRVNDQIEKMNHALLELNEKSIYLNILNSPVRNNNINRMNMISMSPIAVHNLDDSMNEEDKYHRIINELKSRLSEIEEREIMASRVLAKPLDEIQTLEILTEKAERSLYRVNQRFHETTPTKSHLKIQDLQDEVDILIAQNYERRNELSKKEKKLKILKSSLSNTYKSPSRSKKKSPYTPGKANHKKEMNKINEIYKKLKIRGEKLDEEEESINEFEQKGIHLRKQMETHWSEKMKEIGKLSSQYRSNQNMEVQIHSYLEKNTVLQLKLNDIQDIKSRLKRKYEGSSFHKSQNISDRSDILNQKSSQQSRIMDLSNKENILSRKKHKISKLAEEVKKKEIEEKMLSSRVEFLESQLSKVISDTEAKQNEVKRERTDLSISIHSTNDKSFQNEYSRSQTLTISKIELSSDDDTSEIFDNISCSTSIPKL